MIRNTAFLLIVLCSVASAAASDIRRVVTGLDTNNKAVVLFDACRSRQGLTVCKPQIFG